MTNTGQRLTSLDVTRAVALIGVVMMNYHGYLNDWNDKNGFAQHLFAPESGVLSSRFAATFVVVAGISLTLLTNKARLIHDQATISTTRLTVFRRGLLLFVGGYFLNHAWPGTILFYYGVYFILATLMFRASTKMLRLIVLSSILVASSLSIWEHIRKKSGYSTSWLQPDHIHSLRDLFLRIFVSYTHPVFPWISFFCLGIIIGRNLEILNTQRRKIITMCCTVLLATYLIATLANHFGWRDNTAIYVITSMQPFTRGLFYALSTAAIALLSIIAISVVVEKYPHFPAILHLQRAGQMTLSLYLLHIVFFYGLFRWTHLITSKGLPVALAASVAFWILGITWASWYKRHFRQGPAEWLYRFIGG